MPRRPAQTLFSRCAALHFRRASLNALRAPEAYVVICGGGILGTSVAYHLSKMGWQDIVLLEQGRLAAGSTRFCAGILSTARHSSIEQKMADYSNKLYCHLEQETGIQTGYLRTGSISLAQTQDRLISLKRINSRLNVVGIPSEIISPKKVAELHPFLNVHDLVGALHVPEDAVVSSPDVALALASAASQNAIVDADGRIYIRNWQGGILSGGFEKNPKPIFTEGKNQLEIQNLREDWDHFEPLLSSLLRRMPVLETLEILKLVNCPETFTPDMKCIMGESPVVQGYFVLAGMNSAGLSLGGGAGKFLAEWMVYGYPTENVWELDLQRFGALQSSRTFLRHRVMEVMPLMYDLKVPRWDFQTGRQLRTSPLYDRLDAQGARWMEKHGFERPKYFVPPNKDLLALEQSKTFYKPDWFDIVESEVKCCKEAVCVIDMSSFTKFEITSTGDQALESLQYLFSNDLDVPVGHIVHTGMLNECGGYENDCSIARLNKRREDHKICPFCQLGRRTTLAKLFTPAKQQLHLAALNLIGPRAVDVLSELSYAPMTPDHFPTLFCKEMSVGYANGIRVMSMTHTGEPGFMLYIPIEYALHVYNEVMSVGQKYGIRNAGYYALRSLRIEKFFAFWGQDLNTLTTPLECGGESRVKLEKGIDFIGRNALLQQKQNGVYKRLAMFILDDHDTDLDLWPWWGEPIYRNGKYAGKTTSSAYSYTLDRHVCLGYVHNFSEDNGEEQVVTADFINRGEYEIDIAGHRFQAKAKLYPVTSFFTHKRRKDDVELSDFHGK
ncbi:pyruvate dehydrogenase phosphatase regulatory subunit [Cricetulus griseus]